MRNPLLVLNAGSSSLKFSVFENADDRSLEAGAHGQVEGIGASPRLEVADASGRTLADQPVARRDHEGAIAAIQEWFAAHVGSEAAFCGIGHRVVHGGLAHAEPVLIDDRVIADLEALIPLAPLHQPHHIAVIRAVRSVAPGVPQVACFDTAFHRTQSALAQEFALPRELTAKGVRRYGFHGLSYEYIASVLPQRAPDIAGGRVVVAHLGSGCSACALKNRVSVATTMGFTALDGLPMGTRCGELDPGVVLHLIQQENMTPDALVDLLYRRSGMLGISGVSSDFRELLVSTEPRARFAVELFCYRVARHIASLAAVTAWSASALEARGILAQASPR